MADATAMRNYDVSNMEILSNTENVQAVRDRTTGVVQIIFYKGATLNFDNTEGAVDSGCALILKDYKTVFDVYISDPSHNVKQLTLRIKRSGKEASETLNTLFSNDGNHKGKSHYISMSLK